MVCMYALADILYAWIYWHFIYDWCFLIYYLESSRLSISDLLTSKIVLRIKIASWCPRLAHAQCSTVSLTKIKYFLRGKKKNQAYYFDERNTVLYESVTPTKCLIEYRQFILNHREKAVNTENITVHSLVMLLQIAWIVTETV